MNIKQLKSDIFNLGDVIFALDSIYMVMAYDELDLGFLKETVFVVGDMLSHTIEMYNSDIEFALTHKVLRKISVEEIKDIIGSDMFDGI